MCIADVLSTTAAREDAARQGVGSPKSLVIHSMHSTWRPALGTCSTFQLHTLLPRALAASKHGEHLSLGHLSTQADLKHCICMHALNVHAPIAGPCAWGWTWAWAAWTCAEPCAEPCCFQLDSGLGTSLSPALLNALHGWQRRHERQAIVQFSCLASTFHGAFNCAVHVGPHDDAKLVGLTTPPHQTGSLTVAACS